MRTITRLRDCYGRFLAACGLVAGTMTFAVMVLVVINAVLRYGLNAPIAGTLELTESALPVMIFLSLALTQWHGGHIKVVLLTQYLPAGAQRVLAALAMLLGFVLFAWAAQAGWAMAAKSFAMGEMERGSIRFPLWPVKFVAFFGLALLAVQFLIDALFVVLGGRMPDEHEHQAESELFE